MITQQFRGFAEFARKQGIHSVLVKRELLDEAADMIDDLTGAVEGSAAAEAALEVKVEELKMWLSLWRWLTIIAWVMATAIILTSCVTQGVPPERSLNNMANMPRLAEEINK